MAEFNTYADGIFVQIDHIDLFGKDKAYFLSWLYKLRYMRVAYLEKNHLSKDEVWFYKSQKELSKLTGFSLITVNRYISFFKKEKIIKIKQDDDNVFWYFLDLEYLGKKEKPNAKPRGKVPPIKAPVTKFTVDFNLYKMLIYSPLEYASRVHQRDTRVHHKDVPPTSQRCTHTIIYNNNTEKEYILDFEKNLYNYFLSVLASVVGQKVNDGDTVELSDDQLRLFYQALVIPNSTVSLNSAMPQMRALTKSQKALIVPLSVHYWAKRVLGTQSCHEIFSSRYGHIWADYENINFKEVKKLLTETSPATNDSGQADIACFTKKFAASKNSFIKTLTTSPEDLQDEKLSTAMRNITTNSRISKSNYSSPAQRAGEQEIQRHLAALNAVSSINS